jgi:uncharacterized membrane protein YkvA (DUF1232 family)
MTTFDRYYEVFRDSAMRWARSTLKGPGERIMGYLFFLPDIARLLIHLLGDTRVFLFDKVFVAGVLLYIISPVDLLPEIIAGPFGLIEDALLALIVLYRLLGNPYNTEAIREHWRGDPQLMAKIQNRCQSIRRLIHKRRW